MRRSNCRPLPAAQLPANRQKARQADPMAVSVWSDNFAGQGQTQPTDPWPVIDLNPEEWREVEECPTLPQPDARAATRGTDARDGTSC